MTASDLAASGALSRLSAAAAGGVTGLDDSLAQLGWAVAEAAEARAAAEEVQLLQQAVDSSLFGPVSPERYETAGAARARLEVLSERAREHAAAAAAAAQRAGEGVPELDTATQLAPGSRRDWLSGEPDRPRVDPPPMPTGQVPQDTAVWWSVLSPAQQLAAIARDPGTVGALPGVPAWARDRANRMVLAEAMSDRDGPGEDTATAVAREIAGRERAGEQVQLLELDVDAGLAAVSLGDLDTAEAVGVFVPGTGNTVVGQLDDLLDSSATIADAGVDAAPALAVATVAWMGYRTPPHWVRAGSDSYARVGGPALDRSLDGLSAARAATGAAPARTVVYGHSYGAVVVDEAADANGLLAANAVAVVGDPGMDGPGSDLEVDEAYRALAPADPIRWVPDDVHGWEADDEVGYVQLPTDPDMGHSDYYDPRFPTAPALGAVLAGTTGPG